MYILHADVLVVRSRILSDNSLKIENIQVSDDGVFVCRMENSFGSQEAEARVTVLCKLRQSVVIMTIFGCFHW